MEPGESGIYPYGDFSLSVVLGSVVARSWRLSIIWRVVEGSGSKRARVVVK